MLHIVQSSPFTTQALKNCINRLKPQDGLLLIADAVYALKQNDQWHTTLDKNVKLYVLQDDAIARGISTASVDMDPVDINNGDINWIDYEQFVQLTLDYPQNLSW